MPPIYPSVFRTVLLSLLVWLTAFAKTSVAQPDLPGSQVRVEKLFDARLAEASRVELRPSLPSLDTSIVAQRYEVVPVAADVDYEPPKIKPLAMRTEAPDPAYRGFARLGAGVAPAWIGDLGYTFSTETFALRADAHTYGFDNSASVANQRYAEVDALLGGTYYAPNGIAFDLDFDFDRRDYRYYGFEEAVTDTTLALSDEQRKQHFGVFGIAAGVRNARPTPSRIDYYARFDLDLLADNFGTKERRFLLEAGGRRDFTDAWYAELGFAADLTTLDADIEQQLQNYSLTPVVGVHLEELGLRLGATVTSSDDTFRIFPQLEASYALGAGLVAVAGIDGGLRQNNYRALSEYLPYVVRQPGIRNAEEWRAYGSLQGSTRGVNYKATASYTRINKLAVFFQDSALQYKFRPAYDTANVIGVQLEASMPITERVSGSLLIDNRNFSLRRFDKPYLLPSFDAQLRLGYEVLPDKLTARGILAYQNALPFAGTRNQTEPVADDLTNALFDFSIHGDYQLGKRFGAFVQLNNLLNNRRRLAPYYPGLGTNVLAGLTARF